MTRVWYTTRGAVKAAFDSKETARNNREIDRAIATASDLVDGILRRRFYPEVATRYFDWPNNSGTPSWNLWLDENELISVTTLVSAGNSIVSPDFILEPNGEGPPYTSIELDKSTISGWYSGDTNQNSIVITGLFGYRNDEEACGSVSEALDNSETDVDVTDSSVIGVGSLIRIDSERMRVTKMSYIDTTQNLATPIDADNADETVAVADGTSFFEGEVILLDAEKMLIVEIAGNNLIVERAYDGSTLASHTGSDVYAPRRLTVVRGVLGTTAATHNSSTAISRWVPPPLVEELCIAEAANVYQNRTAAWSGSVQRGEARIAIGGSELEALRRRAIEAHGRKPHVRTA